jgi:outer membrane protein assembly factor BamD (BamD/ComL family)
METNQSEGMSNEATSDLSAQLLYHGTKANLQLGDFIEARFNLQNIRKKQFPTNSNWHLEQAAPCRSTEPFCSFLKKNLMT